MDICDSYLQPNKNTCPLCNHSTVCITHNSQENLTTPKTKAKSKQIRSNTQTNRISLYAKYKKNMENGTNEQNDKEEEKKKPGKMQRR